MTKYDKYRRIAAPRRKMSPMWRGVGCLLMIVVPAISYVIGHAFLEAAKNRNLIPLSLLGHIQFPDWVWGVPFLDTIAGFISSLNDPLAMLIFFFVTLLILSGMVSMIYSMIYQVIGPPRYTELDAVPSKHKAKEYKR
jgi:hypothetical protein